MSIINDIKKRVKSNIKTILFPELDIRVLKAVSIMKKEGFCNPILVGNKENIENFALNNKINIKKVAIIDPKTFENIQGVIDKYYDLRKEKGVTLDSARELMLNDYPSFSMVLVSLGYADGVVSGITHTSSDTIRSALQIIRAKTGFASSFFLMEIKNYEPFIYSDCGMIQNPTSEELVEISYQAANSFKLITNKTPIVGFLSHSTLGSSICDDSKKVVEAVRIAKEKYPNMISDGEFQFDTAVIPEVASIKAPNSKVAGNCNVLIFPDLDSGNIAYKITERLGGAKAYGPIMQGLNKPVNDLSRGSSVEDIIGVTAITCLQAQEK